MIQTNANIKTGYGPAINAHVVETPVLAAVAYLIGRSLYEIITYGSIKKFH